MYTPVFQSIPDDWRGRWRLIRQFAQRVYCVKMPDIGRVPALAQKLDSQLDGTRLSPSVIEWMAFTGDLREESKKAVSDIVVLQSDGCRFP